MGWGWMGSTTVTRTRDSGGGGGEQIVRRRESRLAAWLGLGIAISLVERLLGGPHLVHCTRSLSPAWAWFTVRGSRRDS